MRILIAVKPQGRRTREFPIEPVRQHLLANNDLMTGLSAFAMRFSRGESPRQSIEAIIAVSIGPEECREALSNALAMGCHSAIHVKTDQCLEPFAIAKVIRAVANRERADLILCGGMSTRKEIQGHVGSFLAGMTESPLHAISDCAVVIESMDTMCERALQHVRSTVGELHLDVVQPGDLGVDIAPRHRYWPLGDGDDPIPLETRWFRSAEQDQRFSARRVRTSSLVVLDYDVVDRPRAKQVLFAASRSVDCPTDLLIGGDRSSRELENLDYSSFRMIEYVANKPASRNYFSLLNQALKAAERGHSHIFLSDTEQGEELAIRLAARLGVAPVLNVLTVHSENAFLCATGTAGRRRTIETCDSLVIATICHHAVPESVSSALVWDWRSRAVAAHSIAGRKADLRHRVRY